MTNHPCDQAFREASSPLVQHYLDESTSKDSILLLPILVSEHDDAPPTCLHLVHLPDGRLSFCNAETTQACFGCSCPVCEAHQAPNLVAIPDKYGVFAKAHMAPLCETCAALPRDTVYALHDFRIALNEQPCQSESSVPIEKKWNIPTWMMRDPGPCIEVEDDDVAWQ
jgi:hypothetical protein